MRDLKKYKETIKTCEASAQHIRSLVESFLELTRVDSGESRVIKQEADVAGSCTSLLSTLAEEKQIEITVENQIALGKFDSDRIH